MKYALICVLLVVAGLLQAAEPAKTVSLADLPAVAQNTIRKQIGEARITLIERRIEDGENIYDVAFDLKGQKRGLAVGADGTLLSIEVTLTEIPAAVRKAVNEQLKGATLDLIEKTFDGDEITYEVEMSHGQTKRSFAVSDNGKLLHLQVDLTETPKAVQKTIAAQHGKPGDIFRVWEEGVVSYDVELMRDGQKREINIAENGHLESEKVSLSDLPEPARKTVTNRILGGHIQRIDKCFSEKDEVTYEISGKKDGKRFDFIVGPRGRFLGRNN